MVSIDVAEPMPTDEAELNAKFATLVVSSVCYAPATTVRCIK